VQQFLIFFGCLPQWRSLGRQREEHGTHRVREGKKRVLAVGLMSGTSLDGLDAALVRIRRRPGGPERGYGASLEAFGTYALPAELRSRMMDLAHGRRLRARDIVAIDREFCEASARAVRAVCRRAGVDIARLDVIGSHGQTVFHGPSVDAGSVGWQIGSPSTIANRTGVVTVGDFRAADLAAGGCGAPLMPIVHRMLASHPRRRRAIQNIGGIGNVTWMSPGGGEVRAFDTGPGVMLIDAMTRLVSGGRAKFDRGGRIARRGRVDRALVAGLLDAPFFARQPPKSTGREAFGEAFARRFEKRARRRGARDEDLVATATAFTASSIVDQYRRFLLPDLDEVLLAGGGARNPVLVAEIERGLPGISVGRVEELGLDGDAFEALGFALLAVACLDGVAFDLSQITGSTRPVRLGMVARP
jgi:anhydro-N-acetylmuramic acid kinase